MLRELFLGFMKVHVLHHAGREPIYGSAIRTELAAHGYAISPGTLYPLLHGLEEAGFLRREERVDGGRLRKYYHLTPAGEAALAEAREKVRELAAEVLRSETE